MTVNNQRGYVFVASILIEEILAESMAVWAITRLVKPKQANPKQKTVKAVESCRKPENKMRPLG